MVFDRIRRVIEGKHREQAISEAESRGLTTEQVMRERNERVRYKEETKRMEQMEYLKARRESRLSSARERGRIGVFGQIQRALPRMAPQSTTRRVAVRGKKGKITYKTVTERRSYSPPSMEEILSG